MSGDDPDVGLPGGEDVRAEHLRLQMAREGWHSEDRLSDEGWGRGRVGYSIWFSRYDWHGKKAMHMTGGKACYHAHTPDPSMASQTVARAAEIARRAWNEYPQVPPSQGLGGELISNNALAEMLATSRTGHVPEKRAVHPAAHGEPAKLAAALEECRLLAARSRGQDWARHILRFCADAGVSGAPLRGAEVSRERNAEHLRGPSA